GGDNVFADLGGIAQAVRANPWVASADVHRILPHTITIDVREHAAAAVLQLSELGELGELYLLNAAGRPVNRAAIDAGEADGLPRISGIDRAGFLADRAAAAATARRAISVLDRWRTADRPAVQEIRVGQHGAVTLHTHDPAIAIELGPLGDDLDARMHT